jgi:hypothetical protein
MRQGRHERGVFRHQSNQLRMGRFKIIHGVFEFAQKIPDRLRFLLAASGFVPPELRPDGQYFFLHSITIDSNFSRPYSVSQSCWMQAI